MRWTRDGYGRYVRFPHVIERREAGSGRRWFVVDGPHAFGRGLRAGLAGGFFTLAAAKAAVAAAATWCTMVAEDGHVVVLEAASGLEAARAFMARGDWDGASPDATIEVYVWQGSRPALLSHCESYRCRCGDYQ